MLTAVLPVVLGPARPMAMLRLNRQQLPDGLDIWLCLREQLRHLGHVFNRSRMACFASSRDF